MPRSEHDFERDAVAEYCREFGNYRIVGGAVEIETAAPARTRSSADTRASETLPRFTAHRSENFIDCAEAFPVRRAFDGNPTAALVLQVVTAWWNSPHSIRKGSVAIVAPARSYAVDFAR